MVWCPREQRREGRSLKDKNQEYLKDSDQDSEGGVKKTTDKMTTTLQREKLFRDNAGACRGRA